MANRFTGDGSDHCQEVERELDKRFEQEPHYRRRHVRNETEYNEQAREQIAARFGSLFTTTDGAK
jgi:hypothetical protein